MKTRLLVPILSIGATIFVLFAPDPCCAQFPPGLYFGQTPPGSTPEVFAPGLISRPNRYEYSIAFSPDLTECVWGVTNNFWNVFNLKYTSMAADSSWSNPVDAPFQGTGDALSPAYTADGETIFFASTRPSYPPANLWKVVRDGSGGWLAPVMVPSPVSTGADEWAPCLSAADVLYFVSYRTGGLGTGDLYRSVPVGGVYTVVENVGAPVNSSNLDSTPFIAPDERYILFESDRPGGFGQQDLYISWQVDGLWTTPENLGEDINTDEIEDEPYISPDGKYLFFNRREAFVTSQQTEIWWVDADVIVDPTSVVENGLGAGIRSSVLAQNVPNPFHPSTEIAYTLPSPGFVTIEILDVRGRRVQSLVERRQEAGTHSVALPVSLTSTMVSGSYFYRLLVNGETLATKKMVLMR